MCALCGPKKYLLMWKLSFRNVWLWHTSKLLKIISRHFSIPQKCYYGNKSSYSLTFDTISLFLYRERSSWERCRSCNPLPNLGRFTVPYYYMHFSSFCFRNFIALPSRATFLLKFLSAFFFTHTPVSLGSLLLLTCSLNFIL